MLSCEQTRTDADDLENNLDDTALIDQLGRDFAEQRVMNVYEQVSPSVVNVTTQVLTRASFFDVIQEEGAGSGFVIDSEGHILTNYHVIRGARQVEVSFSDSSVFPASFVGADPQNDIAVIKVDAPADLLEPVSFGNSDDLNVGQRAIAIGNPFGQFEQTLTTGVVSALNRSIEGPEGREISGIIQTDAAINRGNSGGPLLDSAGQVIGINTAIFSPSGINSGVGFAIPIDTVKRILPDLLEFGRYRRPWLGIRSAHTINPWLSDVLNLPTDHGLLLVQVFQGSPLYTSGLRGAQREVIIGNRRLFIGGDVITEIDGTAVSSFADLQTKLESEYHVGDQVRLTVIRAGQPQVATVTLAEEPRR